jgi:beta-glucanase (GH16 family)
MPVGDLPGWHQVFADDFTTDVPVGGFSGCRWGRNLMHSRCSDLPPSVAAKWVAYADGWKDTSGNGTYYPSRVLSIRDGLLNYRLHTERGVHMVAAPVPKIPGGVNDGGLRYGRYVVRFRSDALHGYKTAWLLWPDSDIWPGDGEIDFPEGNLDGSFSAFVHHMNAGSGSQQDVYATTGLYTRWHTAVVEWTPSYCRFTLDGNVIGVSTDYIPSTPMHWVLQSETAIDGSVPRDSTAGNVQIDWVVAYTPA